MKNLCKAFLLQIILCKVAIAAGPIYQHADSDVQREFIEVYKATTDLLSSSGTINNSSFDTSSVTLQGNTFNAANKLLKLDSSGLVPNVNIDSSSVTKQGNTFNTANKLLLLDSSGLVPNANIDTASVTKQGNIFNGNSQLVKTDSTGAVSLSSITATNGSFNVLKTSSEVWRGFGVFPILQIQAYSTTTAFNTTSTSFTDTTLSGAITPKSTTSKILVFAHGNGASGVGADCYGTLARAGTNLFGTSGGVAWVNNNSDPATMFVYDSPATTSATTYSVQIKGVGGIQCFFPISHSGVSDANLILIEIGN